MVFQKVLSTNSDESNWNQVNDLATEVRSKDVTQIFKDDAGTRRVLLGKGADGFYGLKVSPEGQDVYDATDAQLVFNSNQNVFKIAKTDTVSVPDPGAGSSTSSSVEVDTGIASTSALACVAYIVASGYATPLPHFVPALNGTYGGFLWVFRCSTRVLSGTVRFRVQCNNYDIVSGPGATTVKYYILQETAA